jgi:cytochrome bd ubiquinol oxidase subunit I
VLPSAAVVDLSRTQFAFTALFHFLFVPLTLGLSWYLVAMEAAYVRSGKVVFRDMTQFWGKLFAINFAIGVVTGITMEFEFGLNWAYFSRFIGDTFGTALAIEGITAFMLEATMIGVFFFAWGKINKWAHFGATILLAIGSNLSILNIIVANSWMQHPNNTVFHWQTMTMHLTNLWGFYIDTLAQIRVGHILFAGVMTGTMFILGISAFYILKNKNVGFAKRSMAIAVGFGIIGVLSVGFFGDQNGLQVAQKEPAKMAAIEGVWSTPTPPAAWSLLAWPDQAKEKNIFDISFPYVLSLIASHSLTGTIEGERQIIAGNKLRIESGLMAYKLLPKMREGKATPQEIATYKAHKKDIGFAMLARRYNDSMTNVTPAQVTAAAKDSIPNVFVTFYSFRIMVACWSVMVFLLLFGLYYCARGTMEKHKWWLCCLLVCIPIPYIASEFGWVTAELGRQPWVLKHILPTFFGASSIDVASVAFSLGGFALFYLMIFIVELALMFKFANIGPASLGTGRYDGEEKATTESQV